jgi:glyoxylase-like metal-dependent hydrolase (beta-lactamase superfamily II)
MTRAIVFGTFIGIAALSLAAAGMQAPAQTGPSAAALQATKIEKVKDNLYIITGSSPTPRESFSGGNTAVFITDSGVVVVDTKLAGWGQVILDKIKTVTDKPVTTIINTHTHQDHTGSNEFFGTTVEIVAQEKTKGYMEKLDIFKGDKSVFLPKKTFKDTLKLGAGKEEIDLYYFGPAHTGGDAWVVFKDLRVMHSGDAFAGKTAPIIDANNGGSAVEYGKTLAKAAKSIKSVDEIITGHANMRMKMTDLKDYADFNTSFIEWVKGEIKAGKTSDQAAMEYKVPPQFESKGFSAPATGLFGGIKGNIETAYKELGKK